MRPHYCLPPDCSNWWRSSRSKATKERGIRPPRCRGRRSPDGQSLQDGPGPPSLKPPWRRNSAQFAAPPSAAAPPVPIAPPLSPPKPPPPAIPPVPSAPPVPLDPALAPVPPVPLVSNPPVDPPSPPVADVPPLPPLPLADPELEQACRAMATSQVVTKPLAPRERRGLELMIDNPQFPGSGSTSDQRATNCPAYSVRIEWPSMLPERTNFHPR